MEVKSWTSEFKRKFRSSDAGNDGIRWPVIISLHLKRFQLVEFGWHSKEKTNGLGIEFFTFKEHLTLCRVLTSATSVENFKISFQIQEHKSRIFALPLNIVCK